MDHKIREAIFKQKSALCLFMEDDRAFYGKYCRELTDRIIREKRILEFENPNSVGQGGQVSVSRWHEDASRTA